MWFSQNFLKSSWADKTIYLANMSKWTVEQRLGEITKNIFNGYKSQEVVETNDRQYSEEAQNIMEKKSKQCSCRYLVKVS